MIRIPWCLFVLSMLAMGWWVFVWPFAISNASDDAMLRSGCIWTLLVFFSSLVAFLSYRIYSRNSCRSI